MGSGSPKPLLAYNSQGLPGVGSRWPCAGGRIRIALRMGNRNGCLDAGCLNRVAHLLLACQIISRSPYAVGARVRVGRRVVAAGGDLRSVHRSTPPVPPPRSTPSARAGAAAPVAGTDDRMAEEVRKLQDLEQSHTAPSGRVNVRAMLGQFGGQRSARVKRASGAGIGRGTLTLPISLPKVATSVHYGSSRGGTDDA